MREIIDMTDEGNLLDGAIFLNPYGRNWQPVGTSQGIGATELKYFSDLAYACIELRATKEQENPPLAYRRAGSGTNKFKGKAVSKQARSRILNKSVANSDVELEEITDGELARIVRRPNARQDFGQLLYHKRRMEDIWGRAFFYLDDKSRLWVMPYSPNTKAVYASNQMDIEKYSFNGKPYDAKSIIPFINANPATPYRIEYPISPLKAGIKSLYLSERYFEFVARSFANGCNPPFALTETTDKGNDTNRQTIATDIKTQMTDSNDGTPPVIPFGYDFKQFTVQYKDLIGNSETARMIRLNTCNVFRIPDGVFNSTAPTRAALDAVMLQLYDLCLIRLIESRDETLSHFFTNLYGEEIIFATPDPRPRDDDKIRSDFQMLLATGTVKKNEARKIYAHYGLEQLAEFEETATKPAPQAPVAFEDATIDGIVDAPVPSPTGVGTSAAQEDPKDKINMYQIIALQKEVYAGTISRDAAIGQLTILFGFSQDEAVRLIPEQIQTLPTVVAPVPDKAPPSPEPKSKAKKTASRDDLETVLAKFFRKQREAVLSKLTGNEKAVKGKAFIKGKESYWWDVKAETDDVEPFFSIQDANKEMFDDVFPILSIMYERAAEQHLVKLGISEDMFGVYSHKLKPVIRSRILNFCNETNKTTLLSINDAYAKTLDKLEEGLTEGQRLEDIRKSIGEVYSQAEEYRTYAIANTESKLASTQAEHMASKEAGVTGMANLKSPNACERCDAIARKSGDSYYPMDHKFGGTAYSNFLPPYHPLCKCSLLYEIEGGE